MAADKAMVEEMVASYVTEPRLNDGQSLADLLPALLRLDLVLERATGAANSAYGPAAATDPFRGLYIGRDQVQRSLAREPATPLMQGRSASQSNSSLGPRGSAATVLAEDKRRLLSSLSRWLQADTKPAEPEPSAGESDTGEPTEPVHTPGDAESLLPLSAGLQSSALAWLQSSFSLSPFDLDVMLIALAPELDLRYERLYAYLEEAGIAVAPEDLDDLASRFRLTPGQIDEAVAVAKQRAWVGHSEGRRLPPRRGQPAISRLFDAAPARAGHDLMALAKKEEELQSYRESLYGVERMAA